MTDRLNALVVVLEHPIRDDDAESLIQAIRHLRGVASVTGNVQDINSWIAYDNARRDIEKGLWEALRKKDNG